MQKLRQGLFGPSPTPMGRADAQLSHKTSRPVEDKTQPQTLPKTSCHHEATVTKRESLAPGHPQVVKLSLLALRPTSIHQRILPKSLNSPPGERWGEATGWSVARQWAMAFATVSNDVARNVRQSRPA